MIEASERKLKKRSFEQILRSKKIYQKHALKYKEAGYPERIAKRMLVYSSCLTRAVAGFGARK